MTITATTRHDQPRTAQPTVFLAVELGVHPWQLACTTGAAQRPRARRVPARDRATVREELARAMQRLGVSAAARVVSGSAAGRDGFWLHRAVVAPGVEHVVGESASLEVQRHSRRAQTERLDVDQRLTMRRHAAGDRQVWRVVRVPRVDAAERRPRHRYLLPAQRDRTRGSNRLTGLLASQGLTLPLPGDFLKPRELVRRWEGSPGPPGLRHRLVRAGEPLAGLSPQMTQWDAARQAPLRPAAETATANVRPLVTRTGIGVKSAWGLGREVFGGRALRRSKAGGALHGVPPPPPARGPIAYA